MHRMFLIIALVFGLCSPAHAADVDKLNSNIKKKGAKWKAGKTPYSDWTVEQKKGVLGLRKSKPGENESKDNAPAPPPKEKLFMFGGPPPSSLDWRNFGGVNYVTSIKNQHSTDNVFKHGCGACWAFSVVAALESAMMIADNGASTPDLSEQVIVSCDTLDSGCSGGSLTGGANYLLRSGVPPESYYPWTAGDGTCTNAQSGWQNAAAKLVSYTYYNIATVADIKNYLWNYGPISVGMDVYDDFWNYTSGIYSYVSGADLGSHALLMIGYDDAGQYVILKNSWGTNWGESGYARMAYTELTHSLIYSNGAVVYYTGSGNTPSIALSQPTASSCIKPGSKLNSAWSYAGYPGSSLTVSLLQAGNPITTFTTAQFPGNYNLGLNSGTVPANAVAGPNYMLKVSSTSAPGVYALSPAFAVAPASSPVTYKSSRLSAGGKVSTLSNGGKIAF